ncbi:unnamed protein product [Lymnaea stagnalis]|uniref:Uncharacterized protein n=1 Tax=Lymnaea stagnalis TaxID=6523 RepID=A0AAV2I7B2_LYMST
MQSTLFITFFIIGFFENVNSVRYLRRDAENDRGPEAVFDLIFETLKSASKGTTSSELASAARTVIKDSDALSGDASAQDVDNIIQEVAESINSSTVITSLFDDDLNFDAKVINDALALWKGLALRGLELSKSSKPTGHVMAAISKTAKVIEAVLRDIDEIVNYEESQNPNKGTTGELNKDALLISGDGNENATSQDTSNKIEKRGICISWRWKGWRRICIRWG